MGRKITDFKDGRYHVWIGIRNKKRIDNIFSLNDEDIVDIDILGKYNTDQELIFYEKEKIESIEISLGDLEEYYPEEIYENRRIIKNSHIWDVIIMENGNKINFGVPLMGRKELWRRSRAKSLARLLVEETGSVDGFFEKHNLSFEPDSAQEKIYRDLKQGQIGFFKDIENKLR